MIMKIRTYALSIMGCGVMAASAATVSSPDGRLLLTTSLSTDGQPLYSVTYDGAPILLDSPLGFVSNIGDFSKGLILLGEKTGKVEKSFDQAKIKKSHIDWTANTLTEEYSAGQKLKMSIEWQVGNNDIAFRYVIPVEGDTRSMIIEKEASGFRFPEFTTTFLTPQSKAMVGWKRTKPSYEENYKADAPLTEKSEFDNGFTFPALFHIGNNGWALLTETGVDGYFCGSRLGDYKDGVFAIEYPMPEENNGNGSAAPAISLPGKTPWRTITVGKTLKPIVETTIPWNLVEPLYTSDFEVKPGKGTWSWILWQDKSINYEDQIKYIDFAADMGYQNVLVDNWWDTKIGKEGIAKLAKYAQSKGVNLLIWYSSSGWWNDIEQGPINKMSRPIPRKEEFKWLESLGIKGIKVDFFGGDKQETMRLYEDILSDANDHGISVIFHGCTLPRGWERMYPNYVGSEAVLASENLIFSQDFCDMEDFNATLHPFIRNAAGVMEYGGSVLNKRMNRGNDGGNIRRTTDAFQLATSILFQNPVQNFALAPNNLTDAPADAIEYMKKVPTTWDDTVFIDGYPGKYVVLARKSTEGKWYIAGVSAEEKPMKLELDLPMLTKGQEVTLYAENGKSPLVAKSLKIKNPEKVQMTLSKRDGFVIVAD
ncbi:MAG: glycoside hydrolase family 97 protein [Muribaculaceae bacterium]|nr:glycoside hydrolase family 97 protein [Muribaculaceae bacterium]